MRNLLAVLAFSSFLFVSGCVSSLRIKSAPLDLKNPKGLPFYAKVGACKQQSVWLEYRYEVSAEKFGPVVVNQKTYDDILNQLSDVKSVQDLQKLFYDRKIPPVAAFISDDDKIAFQAAKVAHNLVLGANTGELAAVVDYSNPMWLNSGRPLEGTSQVTGKFGPDGTLTEVSAQVDNKSVSTIISTITSIASLPALAFDGGPKPFQITIKPSVRAHTHTLYSSIDFSANTPTRCAAALVPLDGGSWVITDAGTPPLDEPKKKDEKPIDGKKP